jgi:hypothetical protein
VTGHIASAVGEASYALAQHIAAVSRENREQRRHEGHSAGSGGRRPHGRHSAAGAHGEGGDGEARGGGGEGGQSALKTVGAAGLLAYVQIYDALEEAAKQVCVLRARPAMCIAGACRSGCLALTAKNTSHARVPLAPICKVWPVSNRTEPTAALLILLRPTAAGAGAQRRGQRPIH